MDEGNGASAAGGKTSKAKPLANGGTKETHDAREGSTQESRRRRARCEDDSRAERGAGEREADGWGRDGVQSRRRRRDEGVAAAADRKFAHLCGENRR